MTLNHQPTLNYSASDFRLFQTAVIQACFNSYWTMNPTNARHIWTYYLHSYCKTGWGSHLSSLEKQIIHEIYLVHCLNATKHQFRPTVRNWKQFRKTRNLKDFHHCSQLNNSSIIFCGSLASINVLSIFRKPRAFSVALSYSFAFGSGPRARLPQMGVVTSYTSRRIRGRYRDACAHLYIISRCKIITILSSFPCNSYLVGFLKGTGWRRQLEDEHRFQANTRKQCSGDFATRLQTWSPN